MAPNKIINIEILRSLAIISVILIHMSMGHFYDSNLMAQDFLSWVINNIYYSISRFCVPIFFMIAAYIAYNDMSSSNWIDKIKRIAIPYIFWSAVYYYYLGGSSITELVSKIFTSNPSFHLWFLPPFLGFVILLPAVTKIFKSEEDKKQFKHLFVFLFVLSIISPSVIVLLNNFYGGYEFLYGISNFGLTLPGLMIYAFAFPYMHKKVNPMRWSIFYCILIALNLLLNIFASKNQGSPNEYYYGYSTVLVFVSPFVFFNIFMSIDFSSLPKWISSLIYKVGSCSFGIYLVHWLVYGLLEQYSLTLHEMAIIDPIANSIIVFLISFSLIYIARKFRAVRYVC